MFIFQPGIVGDFGKVVELKIVHEHGKALADMLGNDMPNYEVGFTCSGRTQHHDCSERIDDVDPAIAYLIF